MQRESATAGTSWDGDGTAGPGDGRPDDREPIAVVGIGLRLPGGCETPDNFDAFLRAGRSGIRPIPEDRWDVEALRAENPDDKGKITTSSGGFLDRIDLFDAPFFNISPKEARYIDPQQRMVLETAWHALEHAGIDPTPLRRGNGGVYMGVSSFDYALHMGALPYEELDGHLAAGCTIFSMSGRLSYFLGWRGPSVCVDTACSSSLSALHMAVQGLRAGECDIALSGGVNAVHHPSFMVMFSHGQMLAADGRCKTFDESADGYSRAEGCGILVLKRLRDAERDGDRVLALIRGTAVGQDGDSAGLTVPHGPAQEQTIRTALAAARLTPADIQYVEAHGTGTPLGDPIELGAISGVFAESHSKDRPLLVGSVKTNIGHMEPASGIVGVIKTILQLRSHTIYPHLNFTVPARRIPWDTYPVAVPTECTEWRAPTRRAVVNSFGFAGTIGVTVLEEAPTPAAERPATDAAPHASVFTLSGKNAAGLQRQADAYRRFVEDNPDVDVARLCYTANIGRAHLGSRLAGVVTDRADLLKLLDKAAPPGGRPPATAVRKVAFLFSGQGTQYAGMGVALYERFAAFRRHVDECDRLFAPYLTESVRALILGQADDPALLDQTGYTQPALFTFEYALARLWMTWGVQPGVLIGHSIGEVTAAAVAGLFTLPDAVALVAARSRLMQSVRAPGGMAAVALPEDAVSALLPEYPGLALAAVNAPDQCVVSGAAGRLADFVAAMRDRNVQVDPLTVSHAFHSPLMREVFEEFRAAIGAISFHRPEFPLISNITGALGRFAEMGTVDYWVRHIGEPVLFMDGVRAVEQRGRHAFVEIGPSTALTALAKRCVTAEDHRWVASARRRDPRGHEVLRGLAELYSAGVGVSWSALHDGRVLPKIGLPLYAFERKRYWLPLSGPGAGTGAAAQVAHRHPLLGGPAAGDLPAGGRQFTAAYTADRPAFLAGHVAPAGPVLPPAAYVETVLALQDEVYGDDRGAIYDLDIRAELPLPDESPVELRTRLLPAEQGGARVEMVSGPAGDERVHATATLGGPGDVGQPDGTLWALAGAPGAVQETADAGDVYTDFQSVGRHYGERYRLLTRVSRHAAGVVTAELTGRDASAVEHLPVEVLECALQAVAALDDDGPVFTPVRFGSVRLFRKPRGERLRMVARVAPADNDERRADVLLLDGDTPVAELREVRLAHIRRPGERSSFLHRLSWLRHRASPLPEPANRHVLVLGGEPGRLTPAAAAAGVRLTYVGGSGALGGALTDPSVTDLCWFWQADDGPMSADRLRAECERNYRDLLAVVAALKNAGAGAGPRIWLVTERAQWLPDDRADGGEQLAAATLWGFGHVLLNEYPGYRATLVDLPAGADLSMLVTEWRSRDTGDYQIAYRDGRRYVRRLLPGRATPAWPGGFELRAAPSGEPADLRPVPADDVPPGPGQVQVRVHAAAIGARDVRAAAAGSPAAGAAGVLGTGCSGTVVAVGAGAEFTVGDRVIAYHPGTLRRTVAVPAHAVAVLPQGADLESAAALLAAYVTGEHALDLLEDDARALPVAARSAARGEPAPVATTAFGLDEVDEALAAARDGDTAQPVIVLTSATAGRAETPAARRATVRPDRAYLVSGGLGGLGLVTAQRLVDLGARHLVLVSRSGRPTPEAAAVLEAFGDRARVTMIRADVSRQADVDKLVAELRGSAVPLGGIVHAAGAAGKSLIGNLDWAAIDEQLGAQAYGGWLLHEASRHFPELDFFIVHSSIAAVVGGATQAHYAAAFAFLDGLIAWRTRSGLPGLAVNWGIWSRVGMSARLEDNVARELERTGLRYFSPARALRTMSRLMTGPARQYVAGEWDWDRFVSLNPLKNALYSRLTGDQGPRPAGADESGRPALDLAELVAKPKPERLAAIEKVVLDSVGAALHADDEDCVDPATEFVALGLDSLMAVELRNSLESAFSVALPASLTFDYPSPQHLTEHLDAQLVPQAG